MSRTSPSSARRAPQTRALLCSPFRLAGLLLILLVGMIAVPLRADPPPPAKLDPQKTHTWKYIWYPQLPLSSAPDRPLNIILASGSEEAAPEMRLDIQWSTTFDRKKLVVPGEKGNMPSQIADASKIAVRLHLSDGTIVKPKDPVAWGGGVVMTGAITWDVMCLFPWSRNALEEAWIEISLPGQTYWLELPYGFARKPSDPLVADPDHGDPVFPPTMRKLGKKDLLVPWLKVEYDLGEIQNHWRVSLMLANPFDAEAEVILSGGDYDLHSPRTKMEIRTLGPHLLVGGCNSIRLAEQGRIDKYFFNRGPGEGRGWGKAVVTVDDKSYECIVPSSLFHYVHGVTDYGNAHRLPRTEQ